MACPLARAIGSVPESETKAHELFECGSHGSCNRKTGRCTCYPPFTGPACNKSKIFFSFSLLFSLFFSFFSSFFLVACPNNCNGRGQCLTMNELSLVSTMDGETDAVYGEDKDKAWDYGTIQACLCDSSWEVGYQSGQYQLPEYFGPDCSLSKFFLFFFLFFQSKI